MTAAFDAVVVGAGFCGGFTTLSTWACEVLQLRGREAWAYALGSVVLCLAAAALGLAVSGAL